MSTGWVEPVEGFPRALRFPFAGEGEKERLGEIQAFLQKDIDVIHLTRQEYDTVLQKPLENMDIQEMIEENESFFKNKKKKRKNRK